MLQTCVDKFDELCRKTYVSYLVFPYKIKHEYEKALEVPRF
jgi:hypothetical protein